MWWQTLYYYASTNTILLTPTSDLYLWSFCIHTSQKWTFIHLGFLPKMQEISSLFLSQLSRQKESECQCIRVCQNMSSPTPEPHDWIEKSLWHSLDLLLCAHVKISPLCFFAIGCVVVTTPLSLSRSHTSNLNSIHLLSGFRLSGFRKSRLEGSTYVVDERCHFCLNVQYESCVLAPTKRGDE